MFASAPHASPAVKSAAALFSTGLGDGDVTLGKLALNVVSEKWPRKMSSAISSSSEAT